MTLFGTFTASFLALSVLGIIVFFKAGDDPVGGGFIGLACVYLAEFSVSLAPAHLFGA